jgi:hypothetical protein
MVVVAALCLVLGFSALWLRWYRNPYVTVTVHNNTSKPLSDVRIRYRYGERKARLIMPGRKASWEIRCRGESDVILEYRGSLGTLNVKADNAYIEQNYRGSLDLDVDENGVRVVDRTHF